MSPIWPTLWKRKANYSNLDLRKWKAAADLCYSLAERSPHCCCCYAGLFRNYFDNGLKIGMMWSFCGLDIIILSYTSLIILPRSCVRSKQTTRLLHVKRAYSAFPIEISFIDITQCSHNSKAYSVKLLLNQAFLCNICVIFRPVMPFGKLHFIHTWTNATDDHKYSLLPSADFII